MQSKSSSLIFIVLLSLVPLLGKAQAPIQASAPLIVTESNRMVSMRDGVSIALDIYRPARDGSYPTLYASAPYPHNDDSIPPANALTGQVAWFVSQGFNYVITSSRGTGASEGSFQFLSRDEQQDHYEIIEWIAGQSWSDGRVLGIGAEYYAAAQWQMAIQNPPSLRCIAPVNGLVRPYHDWAFPGGLSSTEFLQTWYENSVRRQNAFPQSGNARLVDFDMRLQMLAHPLYDEFWQIRSSLPNAGAITVPVFVADSWQQQRGINGNVEMLRQLNSVHKMAIYNEAEPLLLNQNFLEQDLMPFYQWCLQSENAADFNARPDLRYQTQGQSLWQIINEWPPRQAEPRALFLNRQSLDSSVPASLAAEIQQNSLDISRLGNELSSLTFISEPLAGDLEIAGSLMLELYMASSQTDTAYQVTLQEEINLNRMRSRFDLPDFLRSALQSANNQSNPTSTVHVTSGTLKASMRTASESNVENFAPRYDFTQTVPLRPAEVTRLNIALNPVAYRFRAGSRIIITLTQVEDDSLAVAEREDSIYHSQRYPSRLWLPVREGTLDTEAVIQESLSDMPADIQSDVITNPFNINFDTEFNRRLDEDSEDPALLGDEVGNPVIFINPESD